MLFFQPDAIQWWQKNLSRRNTCQKSTLPIYGNTVTEIHIFATRGQHNTSNKCPKLSLGYGLRT